MDEEERQELYNAGYLEGMMRVLVDFDILPRGMDRLIYVVRAMNEDLPETYVVGPD